MNKNLHRIVFNARRGQRMVVAETATSQGKSASGETRASGPAGVATVAFSAALTASLFMGGTALAQIKADPRAPATQQPTVLTTSNGVPQINIQTPSAAGVSRNVFGQFDVNGNGAILNNSRTGTATAVGGYVQANPWLAQGSARIILNEVNSTTASQLQGPVEVAGTRAEVIIANPAGIAVSGGSFINASAVTLTTGSVVVNSGSLDSYRVQGGVVSVSGKGLDTGGADYTNILARAVQVNAGIWSSDLRVVTGSNTLSASDPVASAKRIAAASATQPAAAASVSSSDTVSKLATNADGPTGFALDVSALGGMYAGKIFMVGTEAGMGVRNGGALGATSGDIVLSNNGWLSSSGSFYASGNTSLSTQGSQTHSGTTAAQGNLTLTATGSGGSIASTSQSLVAGGLKADGTLTGGAQTTVTASQGLSMAGKVITPGALQLTGPAVNLSGAQVQADSATITSSTPGANLHADNSKIYVTQTLQLSTGQTLHTSGATVVAKKLNIGAHSIVNTGGSLGQSGEDDLQITLAGSLDNGSGHIAGGGNVQISSSSLTNAEKGSVYAAGKLDVTTGQLGNSGSLYAGGDLNLTVANSVSNAGPGGLIASGGNTTITAGSLGNTPGASIIAGMQSDGKLISGPTAPNLSITTNYGLHNQGNLSAGGEISLKGNGGDVYLGGSTNAGGNIGIRGESIGISGALVTAKDLEVQAKADFRIEGSGQIGGSALVTAGGGFSLDGQFTVNKDLNLTAGGINTRPGSFLTVGHNANLTGGAGVSLGGATTVGNLLALSGKTIALTGPVDAASTAVSGGTITLGEAGGITNWKGNLSLAMSGDVNALGGLRVANSASISSGGAVYIGGNAQSGGGLSISASGNLQVDGTVSAAEGTALSAGGTLDTLSVHGTSVSLDGQQVTVTGSVVGTTGATHLRGTNGIAVTGDVSSGGGSGVVATTSGALDIGGATSSGAGMTLQAGTTIHLGQQTQATGAMHLQAGGNITADQGLAGGAVAIQAQNLTVAQNVLSGGALQAQTHAFNVTGNVLSGGDTQIVAAPQAGAMGASTIQIGGALATTGALNVQSSGTLQVASSTQADGSLQLTAQGITLGGKTTSGGNSSINAQGAALNVAGMVGSAGNQSLAGSTITVQGAQALGQMDLQASGGTINSTSSLLAAHGLTANAAGAITVQGHIASDGATTLQSTGQVNASGTLASGAGGLKVDAGGDIAAATLQSLGDSKLNSTANVTLGNALNIGSYTVNAGGSITQAYVQSGAGLSETAGGGITHTGATLVQGNAVLASGGAQTLGNSPASGLTATGSITATATTGTISVGADLLANGNITTTATQGSIAVGGNLATQGTVGATAQNGITVGGALAGQSATLGSSAGGVQIASNVQVQTNLNVTAQTNVQAGGTTVAGGTLQASSTSGSVAFGSDLSVGNTTTITAGNGITLGGNSKLVGATALQSTTGTISNNGVLATNQTLTVSGNADLLNQGSLQSAGNMTLAAHNITSSAGSASAITTGGALNANATGALNLNNTVSVTAKTTIALASTGGGTNAGTIQAGNAISLSGGSLANSGQIASQTVSSTGGISNTGTVYGSDTVAVTGSTTNTGQIVATNSVNLGSTGNSGVIQAQTVSLGSTSNGGSIAGNTVTASSMSNSGSVGATNDINVSGDVNNTGAVAASSITFNGGTLVNSGQVHASGNITINASSINNTAEVVAPIPGVPENTNIPYASSGAIKADGILAISGGSLNNTGTLSSGGVFNIAMGGGISNNKRGFILSGGDITMTAAGVTNDGIVYGLGGAPSTVTVASTGGVANGSTGVLIAGNQLTITATSFTNAGDNISAGVGSLGNANLSTVGGWDAGANPLKANGLLTVNTNGITVDVGKTWEAANVKWNGTLTNYGTVNLGLGNGTVHNESTGGVIRVDTPNTGALAGSYEYTATPPAGYTDVTFVGYTDVLNRARFAAGSFTGGITNIAGDVSAGAGSVAGYNPLKIDQTTIWSGVPVGAPPGTAAEQIFVDSKSIARADFPGTSIIALVGPSAGTIVGGTVTISAGDLTVDKSNTGAAQGGISSAQSLTVGSISGSPAGLAALQNPALLAAAAQQAAALQANAIASGTVTTTVGASSTLGSAGTFTTNPSAPSGAPSGEGGSTLALPAPDLSTVQGAFTALNAQKVNTIVTDWQALGAQANAINVTNLTLNVSGTLTNAGTINATSGLKITAAGGIDNSGGLLKAGEWVQLDSQGLGLINSGGTIQSGGGIKATITGATGNVVNNGGTIAAVDSVSISATGNITATNGRFSSTNYDVVLDADGKLTLTDTQVSAKNGVAHLYGAQGVTIAATQQTKTTTVSTNVVQGIQHDAVAAQGWDNEGKAATFEITGSSGTTTTTTTTEWATSSVDAKQIDIQSSKGGVTIDASDLNATKGVRVSAAQDVRILAQKGVANSTTTLSTGTLQQVGGSWDGGGTQQLVTTTTDGGSSNQETLRVSTLNAGAGTLSIESTGGNIYGQSAQLSGNKIQLVTTKAQDGTKLDANGNTIAATNTTTKGGGSINLESLQVNGKTVGLADASTGTSALTTQTLTTVQGTLTATGDDKTGGITISANKDVALTAMDIDAGKGNIHVQAGGNVKLGANADAEQRNQTRNTISSSFFTSTTTNSSYQANEVNAAVTSLSGNNITINAADSITNYAAQIDGTGTVLQKAGNSALTYTATEVRKYSEENKSTTSLLGLVDIGHANSTTRVLSTEELGSQVFGKQVGIQAKDVVIVGAHVAATEQLEIKADNNVTITAATNTYSATHSESKSGWDLSVGLGSGVSLSKSSSSQNINQSGTTSSGSVLGGNTVLITSGKDTTIQASSVVADKGISVTAGGNINILAAANTTTSTSQAQSSSTSIGLIGGISARQTLFSSNNMSSTSEGTSTTHTTSLLSANGGNLNLTANNGTVTVQGADLLAQGKVIVKAQDVDLQAITDTSTSSSQTQTSSFTVGAALAGTVGSKVTAISDNLQTAQNTTNDRLQGAAALRAGYDAYKLVNGGATKATKDADDFRAANGDKSDPNGGSAFGISFSVGSSSSKQSSNTTTSISRGTTLQAQDIEITATKGDITATGAKLQANNITLDAAQDINLLAAVNTTTIQSSSESHSVGAGVTIGLGKQTGISFQLNASQSNGNANGSETTFDNTLVTATNTLTVKSGGNTNLVGAQLAGNTVKMDVGGDLNIVTLQDKSDFASEQHSSGFGISLCLPPLCAGGAPVTGSINKNDASINHNYQSAKGQSGIAAGSGGYDITVNGNTHLAGGAITSTAPQDQNTLKTGSLTSTDVNNSQTTSSESSSISLGYNGASGVSTLLTNARTNALANLASLNGGAGMPANGSQSGTTQSVISPGNVTITGTGNATIDANSNTQLATLTSRDASKANGALTNTLTLQQAQQIPAEQQKAAENAQISQLIAPVVFNAVGDIAQKNDWAESSPQKIALHAVAGYIVASAGGGNGGQGAVAAAANEATTSSISSIVDKAMPIPAGATPAQARQIEADRNVVKETASTLVGIGAVAATGGTNQQMATGGNIALAADQYNRQLHPTEAKLIKDNAAQYAARRGISVERAEAELTQQAQRNNDSAHAERLGAGDAQAQAFLQTLGAGKTMVDGLTGQTYQLFSADQATRNNHAQFGQYAKTSPDVQQLLDLAYTNVYKPKGGQTITGVNGSNAGALTGSDLALNDAARDYGNMRKQPAVVQWAVLGELRQERHNNLQSQLGLTEELQQLNSRGDNSPAAATRRGEIFTQLTRLDAENSTLRQASVEQIRAMGSVGLLKPIDQREWGEGAGEAIASSGLSLKGLSTASISGRLSMLREAAKDSQAAAAAAKAEAVAISRARVENNTGANGGVSNASSVSQLTTAERATGGQVIDVNPAELRWTQTTAGGNGRADAMRTSMAENGYNGPPIDVVKTPSGIVTVDHTRAAVALEQGITSIPATLHLPTDLLPASMAGRFGSATTWGEAAAYRAANQRPPLPADGTPTPPKLPAPKK